MIAKSIHRQPGMSDCLCEVERSARAMDKNGIGVKLNGLNNVIARCIVAKCRSNDNISAINGRIISYIYRNKSREVFAKDIESEFMVTRSTVSKVIDTMESKGLLIRVPIERDARLKKLVLTQKAEELVKQISREIEHFEAQILDGFSKKERKQLFSYIERMTENMLKIM